MASTSSPLSTLSPNIEEIKKRLTNFVEGPCIQAEEEFESHLQVRVGAERWTMEAVPPCLNRLKAEAKRLGLWNLFLPQPLPTYLPPHLSPSIHLSNREYGILCEIMGRSFLAPEACNCSAPDTGNMEVLLKHGTKAQQIQYLQPLLEGTIRSAFLMTEPNVASSDATNIETKLTKILERNDNDNTYSVKYVLNGKKWWSSGAMDPRCKIALVLTRMDYSHPSLQNMNKVKGNQGSNHSRNQGKHGAHTVVLVPMSKITMIRPLTVFGYDDAPHGHAECELINIQLDESCLILGEGRGFEIAQSRLGPGRIHHCMRAVGIASRCYDLMLDRSLSRKTFGRYLWEHGGCQEMIADSLADLECARLLTLSCAAAIDQYGADKARDAIASIKVAVPRLTYRVVDRAVQVFGGAGVSGDFPIAKALCSLRSLRIADGPDAVHQRTVARIEILKAKQRREKLRSKSKL